MKKFASLLFALVLLCCSISYAEKEDLNDAEIAAYVFDTFAGEGKIINMPKIDDYDVINSRYIFIKDKELGTDLAVMIRTSETEMAFWDMELNSDNLIKAQLALSENAPFCMVVAFENNEFKDSATYFQQLNTVVTFEDFKSNVKDIIGSLTPDGVFDEVEKDPFLSIFPEFYFAMDKDTFLKQNSDLGIIGTGDVVFIQTTIDGASAVYTISFVANKIHDIAIMIDKDHEKQYREKYTEIYGKPMKSSFSLAMIGMPEESANGDTYVWKNDTVYILLHDAMIYYNPVY